MRKPGQGEPVDQLWRTVAELVDIVEALSNLEVQITIDGQAASGSGHLQLSASGARLVLNIDILNSGFYKLAYQQ
jgi:hypothetical protein